MADPEPRSEQLLSVGVASGCILIVVALGALLAEWFTLRWTIVGLLGLTALVMLYVLWTTRSRAHVAHCGRCHRPSREGLFCAWCGMQHATRPPRVLDDVSIEISGGKTSLLVPYGTALPFTMREELSTAVDVQEEIFVHLLTGTDKSSVRRTVAMFTSKLVLRRPKATPKIVIELRVDTTGEVELDVTEQGTDNKLHATGFKVPVTEEPSVDTADSN